MNFKERYQNKANNLLDRLNEGYEEEVEEKEDAEEEFVEPESNEDSQGDMNYGSLEKEITGIIDSYGLNNFLGAVMTVLDQVEPQTAKAIRSSIGPMPED